MQLTHEPHEQRVIDERNELNEKIAKLDLFINDGLPSDRFKKLDPLEQRRLQRQLEVMKEYHGILSERIEAFPLPAGVTRIPSIAELDRLRATSGTVELDALGKDKSNWGAT